MGAIETPLHKFTHLPGTYNVYITGEEHFKGFCKRIKLSNLLKIGLNLNYWTFAERDVDVFPIMHQNVLNKYESSHIYDGNNWREQPKATSSFYFLS